MIRKKHSFYYKVFVESSLEDINKYGELDDNGTPKFVTTNSCIIYKSKKDVYDYLDRVVEKFPYIEVMKQTQKYVTLVFGSSHFDVFYNKIGYKRRIDKK